jgi:hypothetical protein
VLRGLVAYSPTLCSFYEKGLRPNYFKKKYFFDVTKEKRGRRNFK